MELGESAARARAALFIACGLALAGCISSTGGQVSLNASRIAGLSNLSGENVSVNASALPQLPSVQTLVGNDSSICFWGTPDSRVNEGFFGSIPFFDANVRLHAVWLAPNPDQSVLRGCSVFVLKDDNVGRFMPHFVRDEIHQFVRGGAGLVVLEEAASRDPSDSSVVGWQPGFSDDVPADITNPGNDGRVIGRVWVTGEFLPVENDPGLEGVGAFPVSRILVTQVTLAGGREIAFFRSGSLPTHASYAAIIRSQQTNGVYYYSFDALAAPVLLNQSVRTLALDYFKLFPFRVGK